RALSRAQGSSVPVAPPLAVAVALVGAGLPAPGVGDGGVGFRVIVSSPLSSRTDGVRRTKQDRGRGRSGSSFVLRTSGRGQVVWLVAIGGGAGARAMAATDG